MQTAASESDIDADFEATWGPNGIARMAVQNGTPKEPTLPSLEDTPAPPSRAGPSSSSTRRRTGSVTATPKTRLTTASGALKDAVLPASQRSLYTRPESAEEDDPTEYLEAHVFPSLLPAIEKLLKMVKRKDGVEEIADPLAWLAHVILQTHNAHSAKQMADLAAERSQSTVTTAGKSQNIAGQSIAAAIKVRSASVHAPCQ
ncbi:hypothetical protein BC830DRAFT_1093091 [Chytriomyces sp. MP71]|nr:hypothetical protein BC830DRAFT_1093091 [Chytriomyces sp. MP71]